MKKNKSKSKNKKNAGTGFLKAGAIVIAVAMTLTAGVLKLSDVSNDEKLDAVTPTYVVEETVELPPEPVIEVQMPEQKEREKKKISVDSILLYVGGWLISALSWLLGKFVGVAAARALGWILFVVVIIAAIIYALKKAFPDFSLKDIIPTRVGVIAVLAVAAVIAIGELVIHFYGSAYSLPIQCFALLGGMLIVLFVFNMCSNIALKLPLKDA